MSGAGRRSLLRAAALGVLALGLAVPASTGGEGPLWDNLVLGCVAAWAARRVGGRARSMPPGARRPWRVLAGSSALFAVASLLTGAGVAGSFGGLGAGDGLLAIAALGPTISCALLAERGGGTRWPVLALDGAMVAVALVVVVDVLVLSPALRPARWTPTCWPASSVTASTPRSPSGSPAPCAPCAARPGSARRPRCC